MQLRQDSVPNSPTRSNDETAGEHLHDDNNKNKTDDENKEDIEGGKSEDKEVDENKEVEENKEVDGNNENKVYDSSTVPCIDPMSNKDLLKVSCVKILLLLTYFDMYYNVLSNFFILNIYIVIETNCSKQLSC